VVADGQFASRHAFVEAVVEPGEGPGVGPGDRSGDGPADGPGDGPADGPVRFRQVGPVLAGMPVTGSPVVVDPDRLHTDGLLAGAGLAPSHIAALRERGVVA